MTLDPSRARCKPLQRKPDHTRHGVSGAVSAHGAFVDFKRTRCTSLCQSSEGERGTKGGGGHAAPCTTAIARVTVVTPSSPRVS